jgi:hypothetical protein
MVIRCPWSDAATFAAGRFIGSTLLGAVGPRLFRWVWRRGLRCRRVRGGSVREVVTPVASDAVRGDRMRFRLSRESIETQARRRSREPVGAGQIRFLAKCRGASETVTVGH